jgi:hypothetical protein
MRVRALTAAVVTAAVATATSAAGGGVTIRAAITQHQQ